MVIGRAFTVTLATVLPLFGVAAATIASAAANAATAVDYARDVRPILADKCFHCHGPDAAERQADLRLDTWQAADDVLGAADVISPGKPDESELVARITSDDPDLRMPPAAAGKTLTPEQIETFRRWIAAGAAHKEHWAFVPPQRPPVPPVRDAGWVRNPIDAFVLARLESEGLEPSPPADGNTLLRRLSLDLIGLPPTLAEIAEFEAGEGEERFDRQIERFLGSPHFGERWGRLWLDAARYADSDGFEKDKPRFVWMYRDWVIGAINQNMPYDEFLIEQIAGDLLPQPTQDQLVATGFLRNSMINEEGGIDPEQFRMEAMFDRMDAIGKGMLGLTIQCGQCHSHKYDPLSQTEYYRMFAFLNNCHEAQITVYTPRQEEEWRATERLIHEIENDLREANPDWAERMAAWEETVRDDQPEWTVVYPETDAFGDQKHTLQEDGSILAAGYAPTFLSPEFTADAKLPKITAVRLELLNDANLPHGGPGRSIYGTCALTEFKVDAAPLNDPAKRTNLKIVKATADANPPERELDKIFDDRSKRRRVTGPIEYANDGNELTAWGIDVGPGRSNVRRNAVFLLEKPIAFTEGARVTFTVAQNHGGWNSDDNQNNNLGRFRFSVTSAENAVADPLPPDVRAILQIPAAERTPQQVAKVFSFWRTTVSEWQEENRRIEALWQSHPQGTTQLVLAERETPRKSHRLERGNFLAPAEEVTPGVPAFLHPLANEGDVVRRSPDPARASTEGLHSTPTGRPSVRGVARSGDRTTTSPSRLDFARWLADRRSPTTARSIVNRIWQAYFGTGLVETAEDLGTQSAPPSHPELLDWLAVELTDHGWDLKHLHRLIVTSSTYRQSSKVSPQLLARDPGNRLLARGPRFRVEAEVVRDIALAASGLLYDKVGGPSVYPPAPDFLFQPPSSYGPKPWHHDTGPDRYRRAIYTTRYRSVPYPALQNFDAPNGEFACARRVCSNTPLQALTTLNETLYVESARALALCIVKDGGESDAERIKYAVRRCVSRDPRTEELAVLQDFLARQNQRFDGGAEPWHLLVDDDKAKEKLSAKLPADVKPANLAAWTAVARVVLNLDETITKE